MKKKLNIVSAVLIAFVLTFALFAPKTAHAVYLQTVTLAQRVSNLESAVFGGQPFSAIPANLTGAKLTNPQIVASGDSTAYCAVPIGSVAYASFGTAASGVTGSLYTINVSVPRNATLHGFEPLWGATVGTNLINVALYNSAGTILANSATGGTVTVGANALQQIPFSAAVNVTGPSVYFVGVQVNGITDFYRGVANSTFVNTLAGSSTGTFGTIPTSITLPTGTTGGVIGCLY